MEEMIEKMKETIDSILSDVNGRAEEVKENFASFKDVFGKEFEIQADNFNGYKERLESKGKKIFNGQEFIADVKEELEFVVSDLRTTVDRVLDGLKDKVNTAK